MKNEVRLAIEMWLTFEILVESTAGHAAAYAAYATSPVQVAPHPVEGNC